MEPTPLLRRCAKIWRRIYGRQHSATRKPRSDRGMEREKKPGSERHFVRGQLAALDGLRAPAAAPAPLPETARQQTLKEQQKAKRERKQKEATRAADFTRQKQMLLEEGHDEVEAHKLALRACEGRTLQSGAGGMVRAKRNAQPSTATIEGRRVAARRRLAKAPEQSTAYLTPGFEKLCQAPQGLKVVHSVLDASIICVGDMALARTTAAGFVAKIFGRRLAEPGYFDLGLCERARAQCSLVFKKHLAGPAGIHVTDAGRERFPKEAAVLDRAFEEEDCRWTRLGTMRAYTQHKCKKALLDSPESLTGLHTMFGALDRQRQGYEAWST